MGRLDESEDLFGVSSAQDPQGLLVPAPGLPIGQIVGKIRTLHQKSGGTEEGNQGLGQGIPVRRLAGAPDGNGDNLGLGAIMSDKREESPDPMLLGKKGKTR